MAEKKKKLIVTLSSDRPAEDVEKALEKAGFKVDEKLKEIGVLVGRADEKAMTRLRAIPGVADVEGETDIDIGPPASDKSW